MEDRFENVDGINAFYRYCSEFSELVIYGAGEVGQMTAEFMEKENIPFSCFCVTAKPEKLLLAGHKVKTIDEEMAAGTDIGFIVAVSKKNSADICQLLRERNIRYFYDGEFFFQLFLKKCKETVAKVLVRDGCLERVFDHAFDRDINYLCCPASIGDTLYVASLVKAYKKEHPEVQKVCLVLKECHQELGSLFPAVDQVMVSNEMVEALDWYSLYTQTWSLKNYRYGHFKKNIRFEYDPGNNREDCQTILPRYRKLILDLSETAQLETISLDREKGMVQGARQEVVLMPYAKTAAMLPESFWEELAKRLGEKGYCVYTNVGNKKEKPIQQTAAIKKPLRDTALFCESCRAVVSLRSGLCDLLGFTRTKLVVINPSEGLATGWNLQAVFHRDGIYNINCFDNKQYEEKLDEIIKIVG